jgi:cell division protease FtsH
VACHEAGHGIVASVLPDVDAVQKISVVQRGVDVLGHTLQLPGEERHLMTRQSLLNQLAVWLGGRAAEEVVFKEMSTGAQNDLLRATDLARSMVAEFGMSETLGPVSYKGRNQLRFLDVSGAPAEPLSEETAREIDLEVKALVIDAHARARSILMERRNVLDTLTRRLVEREVVEGSEIRALIEQAVPTAPRAA